MRTDLLAPVLSLLVVAAVVTPVAAAVQDTGTQSSAYAGTHVSFETTDNAIVGYTVANATIAESIAVQSTSEADVGTGIDIGVDLSAVTDLAGASLALEARSNTEASVQSESGATIRAHDNMHGSLVVEAGGSAQYVLLNVSADATAESDGEHRVVITTANGTQASVLAVGNASVAVNEEGDLAGEVGQDGRLVVRSYAEARDERDEAHEDLIVNGTATASVYVMDESGETVNDTVAYDSNTSVDVTQSANGEVTMVAERSTHNGTVLLTQVSESVIDASGDIEVQVDTEAAVEASSYSELESAFGSDTSKYMIESAGEASAATNVLIAVNHFSEREVTMSDSDSQSSDDPAATPTPTPAPDEGADDTDPADDPTATETTTSGQPGFGALLALGALVALGVGGYLTRS